MLFARRWARPSSAGERTTLILIHDSLGCVALWRDFPADLAAATDCDVVAYDRVGFGQSDAFSTPPANDFIVREAQLSIPALRKTLDFDRFGVFGHSIGGAMAVATAAALGTACRFVVTEAAQAFVEERTLRGIANAACHFADPEWFARLRRYHGDKAEAALAGWVATWTAPAFASWSLDDLLPAVACPLLAIHGADDEYGSLAHPVRIVAGAAGPAEMQIIPDCGHIPHRQHAAIVLARVAAFVRRYPAN